MYNIDILVNPSGSIDVNKTFMYFAAQKLLSQLAETIGIVNAIINYFCKLGSN